MLSRRQALTVLSKGDSDSALNLLRNAYIFGISNLGFEDPTLIPDTLLLTKVLVFVTTSTHLSLYNVSCLA